MRDRTYDESPRAERDMDWRKEGVAVVVDLDRVEGPRRRWTGAHGPPRPLTGRRRRNPGKVPTRRYGKAVGR